MMVAAGHLAPGVSLVTVPPWTDPENALVDGVLDGLASGVYGGSRSRPRVTWVGPLNLQRRGFRYVETRSLDPYGGALWRYIVLRNDALVEVATS